MYLPSFDSDTRNIRFSCLVFVQPCTLIVSETMDQEMTATKKTFPKERWRHNKKDNSIVVLTSTALCSVHTLILVVSCPSGFTRSIQPSNSNIPFVVSLQNNCGCTMAEGGCSRVSECSICARTTRYIKVLARCIKEDKHEKKTATSSW